MFFPYLGFALTRARSFSRFKFGRNQIPAEDLFSTVPAVIKLNQQFFNCRQELFHAKLQTYETTDDLSVIGLEFLNGGYSRVAKDMCATRRRQIINSRVRPRVFFER